MNHLVLVMSMAAMTIINTRVRIGELEGKFGPDCIIRPPRDDHFASQPPISAGAMIRFNANVAVDRGL